MSTIQYAKTYAPDLADSALFVLTMRVANLIFGGKPMKTPQPLGGLTCSGLFLSASLTLQPRFLCTPWGALFPKEAVTEPLPPAICQRLHIGNRSDWSNGATIELRGIDSDSLPNPVLYHQGDDTLPDAMSIVAAWRALGGT